MLQSHILEGLTFDAIDDATVKRNIVDNFSHTIDRKCHNRSNATIDKFDVFDTAAECIRRDFNRVHLNECKDKEISFH